MPVTQRSTQFNNDVQHLRDLGTTHSNMGTEILKTLWDIYVDNLYTTEELTFITEEREVISQRFESFVELCDEAIRPFYDPPDYFDKFKWVVERVFRYVHLRCYEDDPIMIPFTDTPLTVELLLEEKGWISKLIVISNKMAACKNNEQMDSLFFAGFEGGVEDVVSVGNDIQNNRVPIKIPYIERPRNDGTYDLDFRHIDEEQYEVLKKRMGRILDLRFD